MIFGGQITSYNFDNVQYSCRVRPVVSLKSGSTISIDKINSIEPTKIILDKTSATIDLETSIKTVQLSGFTLPATANIYTGLTWSSSNTDVATVDSAGKVTGIAVGSATITAETKNGITASCSIIIVDTTGDKTDDTTGDKTDDTTGDKTDNTTVDKTGNTTGSNKDISTNNEKSSTTSTSTSGSTNTTLASTILPNTGSKAIIFIGIIISSIIALVCYKKSKNLNI